MDFLSSEPAKPDAPEPAEHLGKRMGAAARGDGRDEEREKGCLFRPAARVGLRALRPYAADTILVGDGASLITGGSAALTRALDGTA